MSAVRWWHRWDRRRMELADGRGICRKRQYRFIVTWLYGYITGTGTIVVSTVSEIILGEVHPHVRQGAYSSQRRREGGRGAESAGRLELSGCVHGRPPVSSTAIPACTAAPKPAHHFGRCRVYYKYGWSVPVPVCYISRTCHHHQTLMMAR